MGAFNRYPRWQRLTCAQMLQSLLFGFILTAGQAQEFHVPWVLPATMGWVSPMVDREGNTLLLGEYAGSPRFGDFTLAPLPAGHFFACLAKADIHGSPLWLRKLPDTPTVMAVDNAGNAFLAGQGRDGMQFGPFTLVTGGIADAYVAKYGTDGTCEWLFGCGSEVSDFAWGVAVNRDGFCYLAATAGGGGGAARVVTVGSTTIQANRSEFSFLVVLNSAGEPHAVVPYEGLSSSATIGSVAVDRHGNAVVLAHAKLDPLEPTGTLQIGDRSLSVDATLDSVLFAASIQPDGVCNWLLPLSRFDNTGGNSYLAIQPPASPAMANDDSLRIACFTAGTQTLGTFQLSGRYVARVDLPVTKPELRLVASATQVRLTWPSLASGFLLQYATPLGDGGNWQNLEATPVLEGNELVVTVARQSSGARFFRLRKP